MDTNPVVTKTTRVLARQILALRRKAANPKEPARKRRFFRQEQRELRQRLMAILAVEREYDPLVDDISLAEIGISGEVPFPDVSDDRDADDQLELRVANAEAGRRPAVSGEAQHRGKNLKVGPSLAQLRSKASILPEKETTMHRPTEDMVLGQEAAVVTADGPDWLTPAPEVVTEPAPDPAYVPNGRGVARARRPYNRKPKPPAVTEPDLAAPAGPSPVPEPIAEAALVVAIPSPAPVQITFEDPLVTLTEAQVVKLWQALVGGRLVVEATSCGPAYKVSLTSFTRILPALLERL